MCVPCGLRQMDKILLTSTGWDGQATAGTFKLDEKSLKATRSKTTDGSMMRVRHMATTPTLWKSQMDDFVAASSHETKRTLRAVLMVRDPLDIVLSGYFYDASGGEPAPLRIPSNRIPVTTKEACATPGLDELCTALRGFDASTTSWTQMLQRLPPKIGVLAQAVLERKGIEGLADSAQALRGAQGHGVQVGTWLVDLNAVMADFDGEIERMFRFLGANDPKECVSTCKPLDIAAARDGADLDACLRRLGGDHFKQVQELREQLAKSSMLDDEKWFCSYVVGLDKATPKACTAGDETGDESVSKHSLNTALEPLKENLKAVLLGPAVTLVIGPARKRMGYDSLGGDNQPSPSPSPAAHAASSSPVPSSTFISASAAAPLAAVVAAPSP